MLTVPEIDSLARGFMASRIILTAVELDIFGVLGEKALSGRELARALSADPRAVEILANALVALDLLTKENGRFRNSDTSLDYLSSRSPRFRGGGLRHMANLWKSWDRLTDIVKKGGPAGTPWTEDSRRSFIQAMEHAGKGSAPQLARTLDLSHIKTVLDLGGGPGAFAIALARQNPDLQAVILDLPYALDIARQAVSEAGLSGRVTLKEGDFFKDDLGKGYDLVLVSSIIHSLDSEENLHVLGRVKEALNPGGLLVVRDFLVDESHTRPTQAAIFAVNMLVNTRGGRTYSFNEVSGWLKKLQFENIRHQDLDGRSQLVLANKKQESNLTD
jgi:predicted O-methyltransferase YrrM